MFKLWRFNVNFYSIAMSLTRFTFQTTITASPSLSTAFFSVSSFTPWVQNVVQLYIILCVLWSDVVMLSFKQRSPSPMAPSSSSLEIRFHSAQTFQLTTVRQTASIGIIKVSKCATSKQTNKQTKSSSWSCASSTDKQTKSSPWSCSSCCSCCRPLSLLAAPWSWDSPEKNQR